MRHPRLLLVGLAAGLSLTSSAARPDAAFTAQADAAVRTEQWPALDLEVHEITLDNGFRIVLVEDHRVPRVAASLWYRVGALQEQPGEHGMTHFLEHAIHQGTTTLGVKDPARDRELLQQIHETEQALIAERSAHRNLVRERNIFFDEENWPTTPRLDSLRRRLYELEDQQSENRIFWEEYNWYRQHGGVMRHSDPVPANTGNELMRIEVDLPATRLELFFRMEADRMYNAVLRGWEAQRFTVLEQFLGINRQESGRFSEALNGVTGVVHPIYLHPGGHMRDHAYWTRASMLRIYEDYFVPSNAILALVGDITVNDATRLAREYFGRLPRGAEPPAGMDFEAEPPPGGSVRLDWLEPLGSSQVTVRYRIPGIGHPDRPAFDVIAGLLEGLLEDEAAASGGAAGGLSASASQTGSPARLSIQGRAPRDEDLPAVERVILAAVERLRRGDIDPARLERVRRELHMGWERMRSHRGDLASEIGDFFVMDEWRTLRSYHEQRVTAAPEEIRRLAERYLVPWNRVIGTTRVNPVPAARDHLTATPGRSR